MTARTRILVAAGAAALLAAAWLVLAFVPATALTQRSCLVWGGDFPMLDWNFTRFAADYPDAYVNANLPEVFPGSGPISRGDACNPPLAMLFTRLFPATFVGGVVATAVNALLYLAAAVLFWRRRKGPNVVAGVVALAVSLPFIFALQVGNLILLSAAASMVFLTFYDSDSRRERILAALALAVAVAVKISPVVLGVLYLVRTDMKRQLPYALLAAVCGALLLFGPFPFYGGLGGCISWFANAAVNSAQYEFRNVIGLYGTFYALGELLGAYDVWYASAHGIMHLLSAALAVGCLAVAAFDSRRTESDRSFLVVVGMLMLPPTMMIYTNLYVLPLLLLRSDRLSLLAFVALANPLQIMIGETSLQPLFAASMFLIAVLARLRPQEESRHV